MQNRMSKKLDLMKKHSSMTNSQSNGTVGRVLSKSILTRHKGNLQTVKLKADLLPVMQHICLTEIDISQTSVTFGESHAKHPAI